MSCNASQPKGRDLELPQKDPNRAARPQAIAANRGLYEWVHAPNSVTPSHIKVIPPHEKDLAHKKWHDEQVFDIVASGSTLGVSKFFDELTDLFQHDGPFQDYSDVYGLHCKKPTVSARWRDDIEFARQRLQGTLPQQIHRVKALPSKFPVTEKQMEGVLPVGQTLASMLATGRIYVVDHQFMTEACLLSDRNLVASIILFFVDDSGVLMPGAIQLGQDPAKFPIFTPVGDDLVSNRWFVAKILVNSSEGCLHEVSNHLLMTHLAMEIAYISLMRTTAPTHPLNQLLGAHFWFTLFINDGARGSLIKDANSAVPKIMAMGFEGMNQMFMKGWKEYTMETYDIERGFQDRDVEELPHYYYRDDARKVWHSINGYVRKILGEFYLCDADVVEDVELQAFVHEATDPAIGNLRGSPFPDGKAHTIEQVVQFSTYIIWASTAYHAALNNGQFDFFGFIPNAPGCLKIPPPTKDQSFTDKQIAAAFPNSFMTAYQISFIHVLAMGTDQPLANFTHDQAYMKAEPACLKHWEAWKVELAAISASIQARNKGLVVPYTYLDPAQIANSVAI